jgi:hypothetical protein
VEEFLTRRYRDFTEHDRDALELFRAGWLIKDVLIDKRRFGFLPLLARGNHRSRSSRGALTVIYVRDTTQMNAPSSNGDGIAPADSRGRFITD